MEKKILSDNSKIIDEFKVVKYKDSILILINFDSLNLQMNSKLLNMFFKNRKIFKDILKNRKRV